MRVSGSTVVIVVGSCPRRWSGLDRGAGCGDRLVCGSAHAGRKGLAEPAEVPGLGALERIDARRR